MQIGMIEGATRTLGKSQGYLGLPVKDVVFDDGTPGMETVWFPTPAEITAINAGAPIVLNLLGSAHPPVKLTTGRPPQE